jgi:hypothetical protein
MALQAGSDDPIVLLEASGVQQCESDQKSEGVRPVVVRRKVEGARKLERMKEGGKEERVYIVVQAARGGHTRNGRAKPFRVIHRSSD